MYDRGIAIRPALFFTMPGEETDQREAPLESNLAVRHGLAAVPHGARIYVLSGGPRPGGSYSTANEVFSP